MMNNTITINGIQYVSRINSWRVWKNRLSKTTFGDFFIDNDEEGNCKICHGYGQINDQKYGPIDCLCKMRDAENELRIFKGSLESTFQEKYLKDLIPWGNHESCEKIKEVKKAVEKWMIDVPNWLTISGNPGCGKTHILHAINTAFSPWSLYITAADLEQMVFGSMDEENGLQILIDHVSRFPILLIDDIGSDYGSEFARSSMRKIIDFRYRVYPEYPTVFTTNLSARDLVAYDRRIGDRVFDSSQNTIEIMSGVMSYRRQTGLEKA